MSMADHGPWREDIGAYLLGALPEAERERFEAHLESCSACRAEVEALRVASEALPASVAQISPPPELKGRIMAVVHAEAELLAAASGPRADQPERSRRAGRLSWLPSLRPAVAIGAVACALAAGVGVGIAVDDGASERTVVASVDSSRLRGAEAKLVVGDRDSRLVMSGMPAPPERRVYQVWLARPGKPPQPTSALFVPRSDGSGTVSVPGSLKGVDQVLVTDEPVGGSPAPTRPPVIAASPA
jgi:anti-sigma-K factor RskA